NEPWSSEALGKLALRDAGDSWMRAAILSSASRQPAEILENVLTVDSRQSGRTEMIRQLIATAVGAGDSGSLAQISSAIAPADADHLESWQLSAMNSLLDALERKNIPLAKLAQADETTKPILARLAVLFNWARRLAADSNAKGASREP